MWTLFCHWQRIALFSKRQKVFSHSNNTVDDKRWHSVLVCVGLSVKFSWNKICRCNFLLRSHCLTLVFHKINQATQCQFWWQKLDFCIYFFYLFYFFFDAKKTITCSHNWKYPPWIWLPALKFNSACPPLPLTSISRPKGVWPSLVGQVTRGPQR